MRLTSTHILCIQYLMLFFKISETNDSIAAYAKKIGEWILILHCLFNYEFLSSYLCPKKKKNKTLLKSLD